MLEKDRDAPVDNCIIIRELLAKDRDTTFYLRGPRANWVTSEASQNLEGSLGVLPWKNVRPRSSNRLKTVLIFVPQYKTTLGCTHPQKSRMLNLPLSKSLCRVNSSTLLACDKFVSYEYDIYC